MSARECIRGPPSGALCALEVIRLAARDGPGPKGKAEVGLIADPKGGIVPGAKKPTFVWP